MVEQGSDPLKVTVKFVDGNVTVSPFEATIDWKDPEKPSEVDWVIEGCPDHLEVKIMWGSNEGCPFTSVAKGSEYTIQARGNKGRGAIYDYSVIFYDPNAAQPQIRAGVDPKIINQPPY